MLIVWEESRLALVESSLVSPKRCVLLSLTLQLLQAAFCTREADSQHPTQNMERCSKVMLRNRKKGRLDSNRLLVYLRSFYIQVNFLDTLKFSDVWMKLNEGAANMKQVQGFTFL